MAEAVVVALKNYSGGQYGAILWVGDSDPVFADSEVTH